MERLLGDEPERTSHESHGGEDGEVLAVRDVDRGPATSRQRVVHRGEVVEGERRGVDHLHSARGVEKTGGGRFEKLAREVDERRSKAFSRRKERVSDGGGKGIQRLAAFGFGSGQEPRQARVDRLLDGDEELLESVGQGGIRR